MALTFDQIAKQTQDVISAKDISGNLNPVHSKLLTMVMEMKRQGSSATKGRHEQLRKADQIYRAYRAPDDADKKAIAKGEPKKIYYPLTYAQIQTDVAGMMSYYDQEPFFKLDSRGPGFFNNAKLMELEIQYQLERLAWSVLFYQWLLNSRKYGFAKMNIAFEREMQVIKNNRQISLLGLFDLDLSSEQQVVAYEGNVLTNEDPYRLCFDNQVTFANIHKGRFMFNQEEISYEALKAKAKAEGYTNLDGIPKSDFSSDTGIKTQILDESRGRPSLSPVTSRDIVVLDHCFVKLIPQEHGLWNSEQYQLVHITVANESNVIRVIPSKFRHGQLPCAGLEYNIDMHETLNDGMAQTIDNLQELCNWFLNSHVSNVSRVVANQIFVDPQSFVIEDLEQKRPYIRMTPTGVSRGIDRVAKQLTVSDATAGHVNDALSTFQLLQRATGINDNFMGMQLPTTRTATEVNNFTRLGEVRFRLAARLMFAQGLRPLAEQMISNTQHFISSDRFLRVTEKLATDLGVPFTDIAGKLIQVRPQDLSGLFDISIPDTGSSSSNYAKAQDMKELLVAILQNPQAAQISGISLPKFLNQYFWMIGLKNASEFMGGNTQVQVMPDEQVAAQAQAGNLVPVSAPQIPGA